MSLPQILTQGKKYIPHHQRYRRVFHKLCSSSGATYQKFCDVGIKWRELKSEQDYLFWSSAKLCKGFSKINDSVNSSLQKWIISHPNLINYYTANGYINVKIDDRNV